MHHVDDLFSSPHDSFEKEDEIIRELAQLSPEQLALHINKVVDKAIMLSGQEKSEMQRGKVLNILQLAGEHNTSNSTATTTPPTIIPQTTTSDTNADNDSSSITNNSSTHSNSNGINGFMT